MAETESEIGGSDEVDRAVAAARRAVGRLARLLLAEDMEVVDKAAGAIVGFGPVAVGPLAAALREAPAPHEVAIVVCLATIGPRARGEAGAAPAAARRSEDPHIRAWAAGALAELIATGLAADLAAGEGGPESP
jgi:hypothetical protein